MTTLRRAACVLFAASSLLASPAYSTSFSTDQSDLYYIPAESGWGMQLVQRGNIIFATLFVYGPSTAPTWYVSEMSSADGVTWTGDLLATTGPWFGTVPFNPANVTVTKVGTMTWTAQTIDTGNVAYTVNGVGVSKDVVRQSLGADDFSGHYSGGSHEDFTSCLNPALNGTIEGTGNLYVIQNGQAITLRTLDPTTAFSCTNSGILSQAGQMGTVQGSFVCTDGETGTFTLFEMQVNISGITGRFANNYTFPSGCKSTGWLGGMRATTF